MSTQQNFELFIIRDALMQYSKNTVFSSSSTPLKVQLNGISYSIHASILQDSGRGRVIESRIQLSRNLIDMQRQLKNDGCRVAFIGLFKEGDAFIAWDPNYIFALNTQQMVSVYGRWSQRNEAASDSLAVHKFHSRVLGRDSFAIALQSSAMGFYLENVDEFHSLTTADALSKAAKENHEALSHGGLGSAGVMSVDEDGIRTKFQHTREAYPRNPKFRTSVLSAYNNSCCICGTQLGAVEAAHIIPHSDDRSRDHVKNGLALCVEHHKLYDDALLLPGPEYKLVFNSQRADYLKSINQGEGLDRVKSYDGKRFEIPKEEDAIPAPECLQVGLDLCLVR